MASFSRMLRQTSAARSGSVSRSRSPSTSTASSSRCGRSAVSSSRDCRVTPRSVAMSGSVRMASTRCTSSRSRARSDRSRSVPGSVSRSSPSSCSAGPSAPPGRPDGPDPVRLDVLRSPSDPVGQDVQGAFEGGVGIDVGRRRDEQLVSRHDRVSGAFHRKLMEHGAVPPIDLEDAARRRTTRLRSSI